MGFPILKPDPALVAITGDKPRPSSQLNKAFWEWLKKKSAAGRPLHAGKKLMPTRNRTLEKVVNAAQEKDSTILPDPDGTFSIFAIPKIIHALSKRADTEGE